MTALRVFCLNCKAEWDAGLDLGCTQVLHEHVVVSREGVRGAA